MEILDSKNGVVKNGSVYGLYESFKASKYPKSTDIKALDSEYTETIKRLAATPKGEGHDNFLCGILVQFDLDFTIKAWVEAERYHFFDIVSSQSTMHRITMFDLDSSYNEYVDKKIIKIMKNKLNKYNSLNDDEAKRQMYLELLYSNPCGMRLTARITTNYRQLKTIYSQRKNHRLPEWREFCDWIEKLPYSELIICKNP